MIKLKPLVRPAASVCLVLVMITGVDLWRARQFVTEPQVPQILSTVAGEPINLQALSEQAPVLLYFWASWCGPCKLVSPAVNRLSESHQVVTVALDSGDDQILRRYALTKGHTFKVINDQDAALSQRFGVSVTPTVLIFYHGKVVSSTVGLSTQLGLWARLQWAKFQ